MFARILCPAGAGGSLRVRFHVLALRPPSGGLRSTCGSRPWPRWGWFPSRAVESAAGPRMAVLVATSAAKAVTSMAKRVTRTTNRVASAAKRVTKMTKRVTSAAKRVTRMTKRVTSAAKRVTKMAKRVSGVALVTAKMVFVAAIVAL